MLCERIGNVTLTRTVGSPYYYVRYRRRGKQVTCSLRTSDISAARAEAQSLSETLGTPKRQSKIDYSFHRFALDVIAHDVRRVQRGERKPTLIDDQTRILKVYCDESLGSLDVRKITPATLQDFVDELTDRDLSSATIKIILVLVNKTMKAAVRANVITHAPLMPEVSLKAGVRGWFSYPEYRLLLKECQKHEKAKTKIRTQIITSELRHFVTLMVNTFMRPSDAKLLRHRHVEIVKQPDREFLRITTDFSKTVLAPIISMPSAVPVYENLLKAARAKGVGDPDDFVFLPAYKNRKYALSTLSRQFHAACTSAGLATSPSGQARTLYSLRHSSIMFRLTRGKDMCLLTLARTARTSVEMIDRFYARHLTAEMNIDVLQSMR